MTNDTIQSLLLSFEDNYHLPLLQEVNKTYITATPESLLNAVRHTEQAITALEHLQASVARLVERDGSTITTDQAWRAANALEELTCSLQFITLELGELAVSIAEKCAVSEFE
ncbi:MULTISPECIES: hypothetical protein [Enterobacteriaceae]|uniref:Uncharacterized protein n=1 Tax=Citrobacter portucalensis TaxID=1639133 RepID=A0A9X4JLV4_9ENTR|nr:MULTISPECIES: hypothetical protein [Enterobacteriaceae]ELI7004946.1 hypothetical protein [Citrobacter freundii]MDE9621045.1 hypothetical protein [Citrobacter portucalensis]MDU6819458.1 hypothetical protein [Leclercia adecarboxylata]WJT02438.1 hypothetical protein OCT50_17825 [Leclercia adecarboxylata]